MGKSVIKSLENLHEIEESLGLELTTVSLDKHLCNKCQEDKRLWLDIRGNIWRCEICDTGM